MPQHLVSAGGKSRYRTVGLDTQALPGFVQGLDHLLLHAQGAAVGLVVHAKDIWWHAPGNEC